MHLSRRHNLSDILLHQLPGHHVLERLHTVATESALEQSQLRVAALLQSAIGAISTIHAHGGVAFNFQRSIDTRIAAVGARFAAAHLKILLVTIQLAGARRAPNVALDQGEGSWSVFDTTALSNIGA